MSKCIQILLGKIITRDRKELVPLLVLWGGTKNKSELRVIIYWIRKSISDNSSAFYIICFLEVHFLSVYQSCKNNYNIEIIGLNNANKDIIRRSYLSNIREVAECVVLLLIYYVPQNNSLL